METLDKCFENVCELDLIFHMDKVLLSQARVTGKLRTLTISSHLYTFMYFFFFFFFFTLEIVLELVLFSNLSL